MVRIVWWIVEEKGEVSKSLDVPNPKYGCKTPRIDSLRGEDAIMKVDPPDSRSIWWVCGVRSSLWLNWKVYGLPGGSGAVLEQHSRSSYQYFHVLRLRHFILF